MNKNILVGSTIFLVLVFGVWLQLQSVHRQPVVKTEVYLPGKKAALRTTVLEPETADADERSNNGLATRTIEQDKRLMLPPLSPQPVEEPQIELELAPGVREPMASKATEKDLSAAQSQALADISKTFLERVQKVASSPESDEIVAEKWEQELNEADTSYRNLLGESAANAKSTELATEALRH